MKKLHLSIVLILVSVFQLYSQDTSAITGIKVAVVRMDTLLIKLHMYNDLREELIMKVEQERNELDDEGKKFEKDIAEFNENINEGLYTRTQAEQVHDKLVKKEEELRQKKEKMSNDLDIEQNNILLYVRDVLNEYLVRYNEAKGYTLILDAKNVLYGIPGLDITEVLIEELNKEYALKSHK